MEIRQLRTFLAVANTRSFLSAADVLFISRQAVSKTIKQLEDELHIELFVRNQNGAMLTPAGIYFYPRAAALVSDFDKLQKEMQNIDSSYRPSIKIYMALGIYNIYARRLMEYGDLHKNEVTIQLGGCMDADCETVLTDRRADAVVSFTPPSGKTFDSAVIMQSPVRIMIKKDDPFTQTEGLFSGELQHMPLLLYTGGNEFCPWWPDRPRKVDVCSSDLDFLFSLLKDGFGILPLPEAMVHTYFDFAASIPCFKKVEPCRIYFSLLYPSYYDSLTYNLLASVKQDVFMQPLG
jgi:DNA-binding transcriptional LysR family regulator